MCARKVPLKGPYSHLKLTILCVWVFCLHVYAPHSYPVLRDVRSPVTRVTYSLELPCRYWDSGKRTTSAPLPAPVFHLKFFL